MCVSSANEPVNTATGNIARSSSHTDHTASTNTNHHSAGMYGFHGDVNMNAPYARISTAIVAPMPSAIRSPPRRKPIHNASPMLIASNTASPTCSPYDEWPSNA